MNFLELAEKYQLVTFLSLVRVAGLEEAFGDFGDYTLFVPDENAFLGTGWVHASVCRSFCDSSCYPRTSCIDIDLCTFIRHNKYGVRVCSPVWTRLTES